MPPQSQPSRITLIVVDNHPTMRRGVEYLAADHPDLFEVVGSYDSVDDIDLTQPHVDVVVLDLWLGREDRLSIPHIARLREWGARVLMHTNEEQPAKLREAMKQGANGVVLKSDPPDSLRLGILEVLASDYFVSSKLAEALLGDPTLMANLSSREVSVLRCVDDGLSHKQIAKRLDIAPSTVKTHLKKACDKFEQMGFEINNTIGAVKRAREQGHL